MTPRAEMPTATLATIRTTSRRLTADLSGRTAGPAVTRAFELSPHARAAFARLALRGAANAACDGNRTARADYATLRVLSAAALHVDTFEPAGYTLRRAIVRATSAMVCIGARYALAATRDFVLSAACPAAGCAVVVTSGISARAALQSAVLSELQIAVCVRACECRDRKHERRARRRHQKLPFTVTNPGLTATYVVVGGPAAPGRRSRVSR